MITCFDCGHKPPLCDRCVDADAAMQKGTAMLRGDRWAEGVARRLGTKRAAQRPWPSFDESERVRRIATAKVANLAADLRLRERLARLCAEQAARTWRKRST